jgi:hypothetical protein
MLSPSRQPLAAAVGWSTMAVSPAVNVPSMKPRSSSWSTSSALRPTTVWFAPSTRACTSRLGEAATTASSPLSLRSVPAASGPALAMLTT